MKHNPKVVAAFFKSHGIPAPKTEHKFHPSRKWRFDYCWEVIRYTDTPDSAEVISRAGVALEVEGAVWTGGRHTSGAGFVKDMEKYNEAACMGWRVVRCQPRDLLTKSTADVVRRALNL